MWAKGVGASSANITYMKGWTVKAEIFHEDKRGQSQKNISK